MPNDLNFQDLINPRPGVGPDPRILEDYTQPVLDQAAGVTPPVVVDKTKPVNPVAQMIRDEQSAKVDELRTRLKNSAELSVRVNRSPKVMELSRQLNLPPETVANKLPLLDRPLFNADQLMTQSPTIAEWATNPVHLAAVKDDLPNLSGMERSIRAQGAAVRQSGRTMDTLNWQKELFKEGINHPNTPFNQSKIPDAIDKISQSATSEDQVLAKWRETHGNPLEQGLGAAIENSGQMFSAYAAAAEDTAWVGGAVALITGAVTRSPGMAARTAGAAMKKAAPFAATYEFALGEAGSAYYDYMTQKDANGKPVPMDQHLALAAAAIAGTINGIAEGGLGIEGLLLRKPSPLKMALKSPTVRAAIMKYAGVLVRTSIEEGGEEVFQKIMTLGFNPELAKELVNKDRTPDENAQVFLSKLFTEDNVKQMAREGKQAAMATPFFGGVIASPTLISDVAQVRQSQRQQKAVETLLSQAQQAAEVKTEMEKVGEHVAASNPESVNQAPVAEMAKGHPHVYVNIDSWDKLFQDANLDPREVAKEVMGDTTVYDAARKAGGEADLQIPTETYVKKLAGTQFNGQLVQDIRIDPEHMSSRQAEQTFKDLAEIEGVDNLDEVDPDVMARLNEGLRTAGFDAQTAEDNANLPGNFLSTMGQRAGLGESAALLDKYVLDVSRDALPQDQSGTVIAGQGEAPAKIRVSSNALHDYTTGEVTSTDHTVTLHKPGETQSFGKATVTEGNGELRVLRTDVNEADQGQGHGQAMYLKMLSMARDRGLKLVSDKSVSPAAARRYAALKKMGYAVTENPNTVNPETGSMISNDPRKGVFEVDPGVQLEQKGKTIKAYKQFRTKKSQPGKLFPLFIGNNTPVEMGKWIDAEFIPTPGFAHRPGWHAGILPIAPHLRSKKSGGIASDRVWAEVEIPNTKEWQTKANAQGGDIRGEVPVGGHYRFNRPAMQGGSWIIGGSVKVNKVLNDSEVAQLLKDEGFSKEEIAAEMKNSEGVFEQFLHQGPASSQAEDAKWSVWEPEVTSTGVIKGAPEWVKTQADMRKLYKQMAQRISEGLVGRYWYEESAKQILAITNGNFRAAEKFSQIVAIYSPQAKVQVNTVFAVRAWNQWKNGTSREDFKVKTGDQDAKAIEVLYDNGDYDGRKTNSFYLNLMHEIYAMPESRAHLKLDQDLIDMLDKPATVDVWMYRAAGYERHQAGDDVGSGKYSFTENVMRKITAELNLLLAPGEARWTPHQIQATIWTAMKARYEMEDVKEATWVESIKKGYASLNEKGQRTAPTTPAAIREHLKIWYKHAMKVPTEVAHEEANRTVASFKDFIKQMTMMVTWEADPSTKLNEPINGASFEVKQAFTAAARALLIGENGEDLLAQQLGVPLATMSNGIGGYNSSAAPNTISRIIPSKPAGGYSLEEVRLYAAAIQYIFKQDAVPWMRPDSRALDAKEAQKAQVFYLAAPVAKKEDADPNEPTKWRTITGASSFETQAAAEAHMASLRAWSAVRQWFNKEKKAAELAAAAAEMTVRGGPYARAVQFTFAQELGEADAKELQTAIEAALGNDGGFTRISPDKVLITNFRGSDGVPFGMDDETFVYKLHQLSDNSPAIVHSTALWSQGEYGYVHDWESDPQGQKIIDGRGLAGRPGLLNWIQGRRDLYEALLKEFSGKNLDGLEATTEVLAQEERGYIAISPNRSMRIGLLANADLSTYIHESGHAFLRIFRDLTNQLRAMPVADLNELQLKMLDDADALTKWMGITSLNDMKIEHEEQFARGFEAYTMEGKAPSVALRSSFNRFRTWLLAIYKKLVALNVTLNPEVRGVFDRMLATDEQIAAAKEDTASAPAFTSAAEMGVSPRVYEVYRKKIEDANRTATEELQQKLMAEYAREKEAWWQERAAEVRAKVEGELSIQPDYLARSVLRTGKLPDGDELKLKLDRAWIKENMPEAMKSLRGMTAVEGGVTPDEAASLLGFASGDELLDSLTSGNGNLTPYREAVESETQKRMYAEYGDIRNDGTMADAARLAVQNDNRQEVVLAEIAAIDKLRKAASALQNAERVDRNEKQRHGAALLRAVPPLAVVRRVAQGRIAQSQIKDVQPGQWLVNARKEARAAEKALIAQDYHLAALHKQRELLAVELYRESVKAKALVDESVKYLRSFAKPKVRAPIGKAGQQYLQQIDNLTASINLDRPTRAPGAFTAAAFTSYEEFVAARAAAGQEVDTSTMEVAQATVGRPYRELTTDELAGLVAGVKHVAHLARHHNKLLRAQMKMELDELAATLAATAEKNGKGLRPVQIETALPQHTVAKWFGQFLASHRKMSSLAREMDGLVDGGPFWEALIRPLNEAADAEIILRTAATEKLQELFSPYLTLANRAKAKVTTMTQGLVEAGLFKPVWIPAINMSLTKAGELMVALNWGNEINRMRLMDGYGWNATQVQVVLDRLTAEDWQLVQGVWDHLDSYWPAIKALAERVDGVAPERVQAIAIETQFGLLRGGYFPISFDQELSPKAHELDAKEQAARSMHGAGIRASTAKGHRQNRVQASTGNALQIRLDIGAIYKHLNNVIHDLTHYEALIDVNRVLKHPSVRRAIISYYGKTVFDQFETGLVDVAAGEVGATTPFERMVNHLRNGVSVAAMGYNFMTAIIQPLGLTQSMVRIGPLWVWKGISRWFRDGATFDHGAETVWSKSPFMAHRSQTMTREINDIRNTYFWLIGKMQMVVDMPTWLGAYERAYGLDPDMTEDKAVALADQAVRDSQGSGLTIDLAKIQRGSPLLKLFTNFMSFFNVTYNMASEEISKAHGIKDSPRMILNFLMLYTVPAILGQVLQDALRGGAPDDPDKEAWRLLQAQLSYIFGTVVGLRELGGAVQGFYGYGGPAGTRGFGELSAFLKQTIQAVNEGHTDAAFWKSLNNTAGILLHYPSTQIQRTIEGIIAYTKSNNQTPLVLITGPERKAK
jgi:predicted GNAT family acetyltransferase